MGLIKNHKIENKPAMFTFTFENGVRKGETYKGYFVICGNPLCACNDINFIVERADNKSDGDPDSKNQYSFYLDIIKKKVSSEKEYNLSKADKKFAELFVKELDDKNFSEFQTFFNSCKTHITENCNIEDLDPTFPVHDIENKKLMIGYCEIFPHAEKMEFHLNNVKYLIADQYCLNSNCSCTDAALTIIEIKKDKKVIDGYKAPGVFYNYRTKKWEVIRETSNNLKSLQKVMTGLQKAIPDIAYILKKRHRKLRLLYERYRKMNNIKTFTTPNNTSRKKIGRNEPCPCGSGKKYKICCGR